MSRRSRTRTSPQPPPAAVGHVDETPVRARPRFVRLRQLVLPALVLVVITVAAFAPVVSAGYIWDDDLYVTGNPHLRNAAGLVDIWFKLGATTMYAPVVFTTLWVEYPAVGAPARSATTSSISRSTSGASSSCGLS